MSVAKAARRALALPTTRTSGAFMQTFVSGVSKALEWARTTPRAQVIERSRTIIAKRQRNEDASLLKYWRGFGVEANGGVMRRRDFQLWIDWMARAGGLRSGQMEPDCVYTNRFNPFASGE